MDAAAQDKVFQQLLEEINTVANQFVPFYYDRFDNKNPELGALYRDQSWLTFEKDTPIRGAGPILEKLFNLPFQRVQHQLATLDAQPSEIQPSKTTPDHIIAVGITVMVTGRLLVDDESNPISFCQSFQLKDTNPGSNDWYVHNDVFRLIFG